MEDWEDAPTLDGADEVVDLDGAWEPVTTAPVGAAAPLPGLPSPHTANAGSPGVPVPGPTQVPLPPHTQVKAAGEQMLIPTSIVVPGAGSSARPVPPVMVPRVNATPPASAPAPAPVVEPVGDIQPLVIPSVPTTATAPVSAPEGGSDAFTGGSVGLGGNDWEDAPDISVADGLPEATPVTQVAHPVAQPVTQVPPPPVVPEPASPSPEPVPTPVVPVVSTPVMNPDPSPAPADAHIGPQRPARPSKPTNPDTDTPAVSGSHGGRLRRDSKPAKKPTTQSFGKPQRLKAVTGKTAGVAKPGTFMNGIRLTDRDFMLFAFLGRYRVATVGQLSRRFQTTDSALRNRLPRLERAGFVTGIVAVQTKPKVWTVTELGLKVAGLSLPTPQIKWATLRHTLGLTDIGITYELGGELVVTEREIRAATTRNTPTDRMRTAIDLRAAVTLNAINAGEDPAVAQAAMDGYSLKIPGKGFGHIPDMVIIRQPFPNGASGSISIELELTRKTLSAWNAIITAYRDSPLFAQVGYFVPDNSMERALKGVITALNANNKVFVQRFEPLDTTAEPPTAYTY